MTWAGEFGFRGKVGWSMVSKHRVARPPRHRMGDRLQAWSWSRRSTRLLLALIVIFSASAVTWAQPAITTGPEVGIPSPFV